MATHRYDPYLWVHLAGITTVPLWLALCALGLAVGSPHWPGLELALLGLLGVAPVLAMQIGRPFYIFSLLALTLKPSALSDDQRRMLTLFRQWWVRGLAIATPIPLIWLLWEIYPRALVASDITPFAPWGRLGGLAVAAGSFAMANLFLQVPISVLAIMATSDKRFRRTSPYPLDQIQAHFTQFGIPLGRLLPEVLPPGAPLASDQEVLEQEPSFVQEPSLPLANSVSLAAPTLREETQDWSDAPQPLDRDAREPSSDLDTEEQHREISPNAPETNAPETIAVDGSASKATAAENHVIEGEPIGDPDLEGNDLHLINAESPAPATSNDPITEQADSIDPMEAMDVESEVLVADAEARDHGNQEDTHQEDTHWDQTTHNWDQEPTWDTSGETTPERSLEVAVVRISDPT